MVKAIRKIKTDEDSSIKNVQTFVQQIKSSPNSKSRLAKKILLNCTEEESDMINTLMSDGEFAERYTQTNVLRAAIRALMQMPENNRIKLLNKVTSEAPKAGRKR